MRDEILHLYKFRTVGVINPDLNIEYSFVFYALDMYAVFTVINIFQLGKYIGYGKNNILIALGIQQTFIM